MASSQTPESGAPSRALSLFAVLVLAKAFMLIGRDMQWQPLVLLGLFWDDALIALAFAAVERLTRKGPGVSIFLYVVIVAYAAVNVPIARLTSSPLTLQMMRATGSALSDSIVHHLTPVNVLCMTAIVAAAVIFPFVLKRAPGHVVALSYAGVAAVALIGFVRPDDIQRNAVTTLGQSMMPRVAARAVEGDWRQPIAPGALHDPDLEFLRGSARGRNVIIIVLESTGAQYLKPYGAASDPMPNLTALAEKAIVFENAYSVYPESIKGLFSVLCSQYPAFDTEASDYARVRTPAVADILREEDYRTALFHSGRFMYLGMRSIIEQRGFEVLEDAGHIGGNHNSSFGVDEPSTVNRMLRWIDCLDAGERFFAMYLPIAGHHPYEVPHEGPFPGDSEQTRYLNALHYGDAALGQLLDGLKQRGKDTNTLFVIFGDHGEAFGQHDANFGHTFFLYEENVRVPLLIVAPGLITKSIRVSNIASLLDVAPTVADFAGLRAPSDWQGTSLLDRAPRTALFYTDYSLPLAGMRDGNTKIICEIGRGRAELFDLATSPLETRNLAGRHPAMVGSYRTRLESWAAAQKSRLKP